MAGVGEDERPGAVRALRLAGLEARLCEERRLLVDREAGQRQRVPERRRLADACVAIDDLRLAARIEPRLPTTFFAMTRERPSRIRVLRKSGIMAGVRSATRTAPMNGLMW